MGGGGSAPPSQLIEAVAQSVEQLAFNQLVVGSIPTGLTNALTTFFLIFSLIMRRVWQN